MNGTIGFGVFTPWLAFVVGLVLVLVGLREHLTGGQRRLRARVAEVLGPGDDVAAMLSTAARRPRRTEAADPRHSRAVQLLERAGLPLRVREYMAGRVGIAAVLALLGLAAASPVGLLVGGAIGAVVPGVLLGRRAEARMRLLEGQLADALVLIASALHAGYSLSQAMLAAGKESPEPLGVYLLEAQRRHALGMPLEESLADMAQRLSQSDLTLVANAIAVERQVGGSLAEILDGIAVVVRDRIQLRQRLRAATAQNRLSASILTLLPVGVGLVLVMTARSFVSVLWTTTPGLGILGAIAVLDVLGTMWIRRVSRIDV